MSGWTFAWVLWLAMFGVIEVPAILNRTPGDTLSEHLRSWFSTRDMSRGWLVRRTALAGFFVWLIIHLFTRLP